MLFGEQVEKFASFGTSLQIKLFKSTNFILSAKTLSFQTDIEASLPPGNTVLLSLAIVFRVSKAFSV